MLTEPLLFALLGAAILIGATGTWSPCGLSMIETLGPTGHTGGKPVTFAALGAFLPGSLIGGAATFGALAWLGAALHGGSSGGGAIAYFGAAAIAVAAALAEARGLPIVPQVRRQLPEHWRRVMPMPVAGGLYGALLGLGFTTFVLSFGVWALAGIGFALADPVAGLAIGAGFGLGRAVPILVLAPVCDRPAGIRANELMTQSRSIYRGFRLGDAAALGLVAVAAVLAAPQAGAADSVQGTSNDARSASKVAPGAPDPMAVSATSSADSAPTPSQGEVSAQETAPRAAGSAPESAPASTGLAARPAASAPAASVSQAVQHGAGDPSVAGGDLVFQRAQGARALARGAPLGRGGGVLLHEGRALNLHGSVPAAGGPYLALRRGEDVVLLGRHGSGVLGRFSAPHTDALAVSADWLVERVGLPGGDRIRARRIVPAGADGGADAGVRFGAPRTIARAARPAQLGRPSLDRSSVLFARSATAGSLIRLHSLRSGSGATLLAGRRVMFTNPSILSGRFAYVRTTSERQELRLRRLRGRGAGRLLHRRPATSRRDRDRERGRNRIPTRDRPPSRARDRWTIWTLALAPRAVYATLITQVGDRPLARLIRIPS